MRLHLAVDIETDQGAFKRVNPEPYNVATEDGGIWKPDAGVLLYPDRRATRMMVYAPSLEPGDPATGTITVTEGSDVLVSHLDTYTVELDGEQIDVTLSSDQSPGAVANTIKDAINAQSIRFNASVDGNLVNVVSGTQDDSANGGIIVTQGNTGVQTEITNLAGGVDNSYDGSRAYGSITVTKIADSGILGSPASIQTTLDDGFMSNVEVEYKLEFYGEIILTPSIGPDPTAQQIVDIWYQSLIGNTVISTNWTIEKYETTAGSGDWTIKIISKEAGTQWNDYQPLVYSREVLDTTWNEHIDTFPKEGTTGGLDPSLYNFTIDIGEEDITVSLGAENTIDGIHESITDSINAQTNRFIATNLSDKVSIKSADIGVDENVNIVFSSGTTGIEATVSDMGGGADPILDGSYASGTIEVLTGSNRVSARASTQIVVNDVISGHGDYRIYIRFDTVNVYTSELQDGASIMEIASAIDIAMSESSIADDWIIESHPIIEGTTDDWAVDVISMWGGETNNHQKVLLTFKAGFTEFSTGAVYAEPTSGGENPVIDELEVDLAGEIITVAIVEGSSAETIATNIKNVINAQSNNYSASVTGTNVEISSIESGDNDYNGEPYNGTITVTVGNSGVGTTDSDLSGGSFPTNSQDVYQLSKTISLTASNRSNYAFALVDEINVASFEGEGLLYLEGYNDKNEIYNNRVKVSETNQPFLFEPEKTYYPGKGSGDKVVAFAVNALPVSQGQFGQYPLYVLCKESIWALEQSADPEIAFGRVSPVSITHGLDHRRGVVNIGRQVIFMFEEGLYLLDGRAEPEEISKPVNELLNGSEALGYYSHDDVRELWVATDEGVLAYNMEYGRWYSLDREVHFFMRRGNELYGVEAGGDIRDEYALGSGNVGISFTLEPVHFGYPDTLKRIYELYTRAKLDSCDQTLSMEGSDKEFASNKLHFRPRHRSAYSFGLQMEGVMDPNAEHWIHQIEAIFDMRYTPRTRPTKLG